MHFTYAKSKSESDLQQGDLLSLTEDLCALVQEHHPRYLKSDYIRFMVITQTCDLVRRSVALPSAEYVSICAVRPLRVVLSREIAKYQDKPLLKKIRGADARNRDKVKAFLERLTNNNNHEYFYIHEEKTIGIEESCCAFLRLHIALRTADAYDILREARCVSLNSSFQAKLGWLVGNIYSRVGTDDWAPEHYPKADWQEMISQLLDDNTTWLKPALLAEATKSISAEDLERLTEAELLQAVKAIEIRNPREALIDEVMSLLSRREFLVEGVEARVRIALQNSATIKGLVKQA